jgi:hypothetical protein
MALPLVAITGKVVLPDGTAVIGGSIALELSTSGSAVDATVSDRIGGRAVETIASDGTVSFNIIPNDAITNPINTSYRVTFFATTTNGQSRWVELWQVTSSPQTQNIGSVPRILVAAIPTATGATGATGAQGPPGSAGVAVNWYVDSVNGNNGNSGQYPNQAFATIAYLLQQSIAAGSYIYLARGSKWREMISGLPVGTIVAAYGAGPRPVLDASDVASNGSFTKTGGRTNVYQIGWTLSFTPNAGDRHCVWENGVRLVRVADVATCDSTPGSFVAPIPPTTGPDTVYVHASDNSSVIANGKTYEMAKRSAAIVGAVGGSIISVHGRRNAGKNGSIISYNYAKDVIAEDGGNHNIWVEGLAEDCIGWRAEPAANYGGATMFISFPSTSDQRGVVYRRCRAYGNDPANSLGFYNHTNAGVWGKVIYEDCHAEGFTQGFGGGNVGTFVLRGCTTYRCLFDVDLTATVAIYILGGVLNGSKAATQSTCSVIASSPLLVMRGTRVIQSGNSNVGTIRIGAAADIQRCTFTTIDRTGFYWEVVNCPGTTALTFKNNIVSGFNHLFEVAAGSTITSDYNDVFGAVDVKIGGTTYNNFAAWQASGQDTNSVTTDPVFLGQVRNGDMRLSNTSPAWAITAGADYEDELTDSTLIDTFYQQSATP